MLEKLRLINAPNKIKRCFLTNILNQKIVTDTTEFKYYIINGNGVRVAEKPYLDLFIDLCNGEVISYYISEQPTLQNIISALEKLWKLLQIVVTEENFIQIKIQFIRRKFIKKYLSMQIYSKVCLEKENF
ncbi:hypothetical protein [Mycoplasma bradburyae]|uniref:Uncharacterized protein n=1 Tax=Mycoplasma bradburyae TaxID=2963128 RepID=A0ABT5GB86_9MOLU|nr:hypothetical protein [Mycoplasma bradburyae]MDC4182246.1 hypothetical protein [Mycoplasma bradburyae]UTS70069.1 hypothetical protein NMG68_03535 [Mycoplasma bradburyae]